jgi:hypothetical protein
MYCKRIKDLLYYSMLFGPPRVRSLSHRKCWLLFRRLSPIYSLGRGTKISYGYDSSNFLTRFPVSSGYTKTVCLCASPHGSVDPRLLGAHTRSDCLHCNTHKRCRVELRLSDLKCKGLLLPDSRAHRRVLYCRTEQSVFQGRKRPVNWYRRLPTLRLTRPPLSRGAVAQSTT